MKIAYVCDCGARFVCDYENVELSQGEHPTKQDIMFCCRKIP